MVTAGVYLIARMHVVFQLSPITMDITAIIGALTLFIAGCSALTQTDIKRILAYSTMSQIGYMFLALGVGAWSSAIFHFFTHAFFKALLFLAAGAIIEALHHEHNILKMGGLKSRMPLLYWTFLAGAAALAALPFITSGFFSKDQILWYAWSAQNGNPILWLVALAGAFLTAFYTARLMIIVFWGEPKTQIGTYPNRLMTTPLVILAILSITVGFIEWPHNMIHLTLFSNILQTTLPETIRSADNTPETIFQIIAILTTLAGIYMGYYMYYRNHTILESWKQSPTFVSIHNFLFEGWRFDQLYNLLFVRPFLFLTSINKSDFFDQINKDLAAGSCWLNQQFSSTQNGSLRLYIAGVLFGVIFILTLQILL
jgi:NADH-quinone oxidoreductase subunit L